MDDNASIRRNSNDQPSYAGADTTTIAGIDENGLGPRLGPLTVTCTTMHGPGQYAPAAWMDAGRQLGLDDSKATASFGGMRHTESVVLGWLLRRDGRIPTCDEALYALLCKGGLDAQQCHCPAEDRSKEQCWSRVLQLPFFQGNADCGLQTWGTLERRGLSLESVAVDVVCPGALHIGYAHGFNKLQQNLQAFEGHIVDLMSPSAPASAPAKEETPLRRPAWIVAGQVGGIRDYQRYFQRVHALLEAGVGAEAESMRKPSSSREPERSSADACHTENNGPRPAPTSSALSNKATLSDMADTRTTKPQRCMYPLRGNTTLCFEVGADQRHLPVAIASMFGKYVRELRVAKVNAFYQMHLPDLRAASGYHDAVTSRFVEATQPLRATLPVRRTCFERPPFRGDNVAGRT